MPHQAYFKGDVLIPKANLKLLLSILVLLRPLRIVFPVRASVLRLSLGARGAYFKISLDLMMRLISSMTKELTHTATPVSEQGPSSATPRVMGGDLTYSLSGSGCRCGSWSC